MKVILLLTLLSVSVFTQDLPWLKANGRAITTSTGDTVAFTGIHVGNECWGDWVDPQSDSLEKIKGKNPLFPQKELPSYSLEEDDFNNLKELNPFLVRYELSYNIFAPDNPIRSQNMALLKKNVKRFNDIGIYVVPVLHYGPGLNLAGMHYEDIIPGSERTPTVFEDTLIYEQHCQWLEYVGKEFRDNPGIAAIQVIVEPRVPAKIDGGWPVFKDRMTKMCKRLRAVAPNHLIVTHFSHSREANPGEDFWDGYAGEMKVDTGGQGIIWGGFDNFLVDGVSYFFPIDIPNMVYSFSVYRPWNFCNEGTEKDYNGKEFTNEYLKEQILISVKKKAEFGIDNNVPVVVDEYGVNHHRSPEEMIRWLTIAHDIFDSYQLPSWYYVYKHDIDPFSGPSQNNFGLFTYYILQTEYIKVNDTGFTYYKSYLEKMAKENGFDSVFTNYFWNKGDIKSVSLTENQKTFDYIKKFLKHTSSPILTAHNKSPSPHLTVHGKNIHITHRENNPVTLALYSILGKKLWQTTLVRGKNKVTLPPTSSGLYILKMLGTETIASQIIVQ